MHIHDQHDCRTATAMAISFNLAGYALLYMSCEQEMLHTYFAKVSVNAVQVHSSKSNPATHWFISPWMVTFMYYYVDYIHVHILTGTLKVKGGQKRQLR